MASPMSAAGAGASPSPRHAGVPTPAASATKTARKAVDAKSLSASRFSAEHGRLREGKEPAAVFYATVDRLGKRPPLFSVQIPDGLAFRQLEVPAIAVVLGGAHSRPVPLYDSVQIADLAQEAGGARSSKISWGLFMRKWSNSEAFKGAAADKLPLVQLPARLRNAGDRDAGGDDVASDAGDDGATSATGRPAERWAVNSFGAQLMLQKFSVSAAVQASVHIEPGHVSWKQGNDIRAGSSQPADPAPPGPDFRGAGGKRHASPEAAAGMQLKGKEGKNAQRLSTNKEERFNQICRLLEGNPEWLAEIIGRNAVDVGDALAADERLDGVKMGVVTNALDGARELIRDLSAIILHHIGSDAYDRHVWPVVVKIKSFLYSMSILSDRHGAGLALRELMPDIPEDEWRYTQNPETGSVGAWLPPATLLRHLQMYSDLFDAFEGKNMAVVASADGTPFIKGDGVVALLVFFPNMVNNWQNHQYVFVLAIWNGDEKGSDMTVHFEPAMAALDKMDGSTFTHMRSGMGSEIMILRGGDNLQLRSEKGHMSAASVCPCAHCTATKGADMHNFNNLFAMDLDEITRARALSAPKVSGTAGLQKMMRAGTEGVSYAPHEVTDYQLPGLHALLRPGSLTLKARPDVVHLKPAVS